MKFQHLFIVLLFAAVCISPVFANDELGYISVTTTPSGGMIYIDGRYISDNSGTAQVQPGTHLVEIRSNSYFPWSDAVYVSSGETVEVHATLHFYEKAGSLGISSTMPEVDVYIDDLYYASIKSGTVTIPNLSPITHDIRVVKAGFHDYVRTVDVLSDRIVGVQSDQTRDNNNAGIRVSSEPAGALVFLNNDYIGKTLANQWLQISNVAPGTHTLTFHMDGYETNSQTTTFFAGNVKDVTGVLKEVPIETPTELPTVTEVPTTFAPPAPTQSSFPFAVLILGLCALFIVFRR